MEAQVMSENNKTKSNLTLLLNLIAEPVIIVDEKGIVRMVNKLFEDITGLNSEQIAGLSITQLPFLDQENKKILVKNFEDRMKEHTIQPYHVMITAKNGESRYFEVKGNKINYEGKDADIVVFHDNTISRHVQENLQNSLNGVSDILRKTQERLLGITESSADAIAILNFDGVITDCNTATLTMFGFSTKKELINKSVYDLISPKDRSNAFLQLKRVQKIGSSGQIQLFFITKQGTEFPGEGTGAVIKDDAGNPIAFIAIIRNVTDRVKMEQSLRNSEKKYRKMFEESTDAIFLADAETGIILDCNQAAGKLVGWQESELIGKHQSVLHPEEAKNQNGHSSTFEKHLKEKEGEIIETRIITKEGAIKDVAIKANIQVIDGKRILQGIFRDITERKKIELKLKQEHDMLEAVTNNIGAGLVLISRDYRVLWSNNVVKQETCQRLDQDVCFRKIHKRDVICEDCGVKKVFEGATSSIREYMDYDSGKMRSTEIIATAVKDDDGNIIAALELSIPTTERKLMEQNVQVSEEKFRTISNSVKDAIILIDDKGAVDYWNPAAEKIFGYTREEANGQNVHEFLVPASTCTEIRREIAEGMRQFGKTGTGSLMQGTIELVGRRKDGTEFPVDLSVSPIKLGNVWNAVGVLRDITERRMTEKLAREYAENLEKAVAARTNELKKANENLVKLERFAAIGELSGMVGHDLRNPLTGIKNAVYFLKKKGNAISEDQAKVMFDTIDKCIDHSNRIINDLLDYSREIRLDLQDAPFKQLLIETLAMIKVHEKISISSDITEDVTLKVDAQKIERVLVNIINNAIDAMPKGGSITIGSKMIEDKIEISIADTGEGISAEVLPNIFSPLFTTKAQGMGFGLAICKRFIEAHNGKISVETFLGKGTTFRLTLPMDQVHVGGEKVWIKLPESLLLTTMKA
jgi:PAS domain S-box-containing protein